MNKILRILGRTILAIAIVFAMATAYSTAKGHTTWYFRVNGSVTVDGQPTSGYMHTNTGRTVLLITRTDGSRPETYLVPLPASRAIRDCGTWHPIRFLPYAEGELNPLCMDVKSADVIDPPVNTSIVQAKRSIQFTTASGKKVKAEF